MQCECNDHASECDISGDCWVSLTLGEGDQQSGDPSVTPSVRPSVHQGCMHNTSGPHCEQCLPGFYGNATEGTADDCQLCPCPLTNPSNRLRTKLRRHVFSSHDMGKTHVHYGMWIKRCLFLVSVPPACWRGQERSYVTGARRDTQEATVKGDNSRTLPGRPRQPASRLFLLLQVCQWFLRQPTGGQRHLRALRLSR